MEVDRFFSDLGPRLSEARAADRRRYGEFFAALTARLDIALSTEQRMDRQLARRFNVFDFVDTQETGLSRVVAYLLRDDSHGQGSLFLEALLGGLECHDWELDGCRTSVTTEQEASGRRIDIVVDISGGSGRRCLAIENKPYAEDQPRQVADYLEYLGWKYGPDFVLVYLSPTGEAPSESSLTRAELPRVESRFRILPYVRRGEDDREDGFDRVRSHEYSLAEWFAECRKACDVDRLRWFLRDGERFCRRKFGDKTMSTDSEMQQVEEFLRSNATHMRTALTVVNAWPGIRDKVIDEFYNALYHRIKEGAERDKDIPADVRFRRSSSRRSWGLALTRGDWTAGHAPPPEVTVLSENSGLDAWFFGVRQADEQADGRLLDALGPKSGRDANWNWWRWTEYPDWAAHVPQLFEELQQKTDDGIVGGSIMAHHVDTFLDVVKGAVPILDGLKPDGRADD